MSEHNTEVFKSIFAAQRAIGKAAMTSRAAVHAAKEAHAMNKAARAPKYAATLREHYAPAAERDSSGRLIVWCVLVIVVAAYLVAMTSDFRGLS